MNSLNKIINVKLKMNWDEDIDLLASKKHIPKQGRRAGLTNTPESTDNLLDNALDFIEAKTPPEISLKARKSGGWADESAKSAKNRGGTNILELERFQDGSTNNEDDDDDIPVIPDIDDIQDEVTTLQDVKTTNVTINKATYRELDSEIINQQSHHSSFDKVDDIDLSFLTKHLLPEKYVNEPKEVWTMEGLFEELIIKNSNS